MAKIFFLKLYTIIININCIWTDYKIVLKKYFIEPKLLQVKSISEPVFLI